MSPLTYNADVAELPGRQQKCRIWGKFHNYLDNSNQWQKIDLSFRRVGGLFSVSKAPFSIDVPTMANGWSVLQSTNRFDIHTKRIMTDAVVGIQKRYPTAQTVIGASIQDGILFPSAFPSLNADRLIQLHTQEIRDYVLFNSQPPGSGPIEVPFEIDFGTLPITESRGRGQTPMETDFRNNKDIEHGLNFSDGGGFRGLKIKQPKIFDSSGKSEFIKLRGKVIGSRFVGVKVIPRKFFDNSVFPVYADTTTTFYSDPSPETTTVDGHVTQVAFTGDTWSGIRSDVGSFKSDSFHLEHLGGIETYSASTKWVQFFRGILLFDTSSLDDSASIMSASLNVKTPTINDAFDLNLSIVGSTPASNTGLVPADYQQLGSTRYASDIDIGSLDTTNYNSLPLDATGIAAISLVGVTKLGTRIDADLDNSEPTWSASIKSEVIFNTADTSGTSDDPYLEVITPTTYKTGMMMGAM